MSSIGEILKERRISKGLSIREAAEKAGISHSELFRIETGERLNPSAQVLIALGGVLGIPGREIMRLAGYKLDDDNDIPLMEKLFPDLKTEKQQRTINQIVDGLARNADLPDSDYDDLVKQVNMFLDYANKKRNSQKT